MALDVGEKRIGVAVSDPLRLTARPLTTLTCTRDRSEFLKLAELLSVWGIVRLIVGYPRRLTGEKSTSTRLVEDFTAALRELSDIPIEWADERLSSKEAERRMADVGLPLAQRRLRRDEFAAALILEWYLEENSGNES
ncbi:MAG: Holliday junction resolvase RuvX [Acidobacteriota bacterium]|jgi:putative holliday junction resolvase